MPEAGCNIHRLVCREMILSLIGLSDVISSQCALDGNDDDDDAAAFLTLTHFDNFFCHSLTVFENQLQDFRRC